MILALASLIWGAIIPMAPDVGMGYVIVFAVILVGLPSGIVLNTIISGKIAKRFGAKDSYCYFIGFIAGSIAVVVSVFFIDPFIGWFLSFPISIALAWLMTKWARMGAKD